MRTPTPSPSPRTWRARLRQRVLAAGAGGGGSGGSGGSDRHGCSTPRGRPGRKQGPRPRRPQSSRSLP